MRIRDAAMLAIIFTATQAAGCVGLFSIPHSVAFSPDGSRVSYIRENCLEELVVDGKILSRSIDLHWCNTRDPQRESSVHIETVGSEYARSGNIDTETKWSTGGSRIAVWTLYAVTIVEPSSGRRCEIRDGMITGFAWLSDGELGYLTHRTEGDVRRCVVCRIDLDTFQKTDVVGFLEVSGIRSPGSGFWSPSGKFLIFMKPDVDPQYCCVNVSNETVHSFGQSDAYVVGVSWAPDSSRAFCVSGKAGSGMQHEALVLDPESGRTWDCSEGFQRTFGRRYLDVDPVWTADGRYVIINALDINGHLVQPVPWKSVPLGQLLVSAFTVPPQSKVNPRLFRLPVPGWVSVLPTGNSGDSPIKYAADYSGEKTVTLDGLGDRWAFSPDGAMAASIDHHNRLKIRRVAQWGIPATRDRDEQPTMATEVVEEFRECAH